MSEPLRIVHAIARLNVGGAARHVLELAAAQRADGHEVVVVAGTLAEGEESMAYLGERLGVDTIDLPALQRELSPRRDAAAVRALRRILRERGPHVLHTHTAKAGATGRVAARIAGRGRPRILVHTYHGHVLSGYFDPGREQVYRTIERALARRTDALVAVSDEVRDDLVAMGVAPPSRFVVVPYGFDLSGSDDPGARARLRAELGAGDGQLVVGWAGRLAPVKQPADLVRMLRASVDRGVDAVLGVVGDGPERAETERLAADLAVAERCRFLGYRTDLVDLYEAFDVLALTSLNEGTPVVAIEALAAGKPVVATDAGGTARFYRLRVLP